MRLTFAKLLFLSLVVVLAAGGMVVVATNPGVRLLADELAGRVHARLQASPPCSYERAQKTLDPNVFAGVGTSLDGHELTAHGTNCREEEVDARIDNTKVVDCREFTIFINHPKHAGEGKPEGKR